MSQWIFYRFFVSKKVLDCHPKDSRHDSSCDCPCEVKDCDSYALVLGRKHIVDLGMGWPVPHLTDKEGNVEGRYGDPERGLVGEGDQDERQCSECANP